MFCKNCGNKIEDGEKFCGKCGYEPKNVNDKIKEDKQTEQCKLCVRDISKEEYNKYHGYCKSCYKEMQKSRKNYSTEKPLKKKVILKVAVYILAIIIVYLFFSRSR